jgi:hypothetical protein
MEIKYEGPSGGGGGSPFNDGAQAGRITEVRVRCGDEVDSIQAVWDNNPLEEHRHGGNGGNGPFALALAADEYITGISGKKGSRVDKMSIFTNKRQFGPCGGNGGDSDYTYSVPEGWRLVGFHGRSNVGLDSIGVIYGRG